MHSLSSNQGHSGDDYSQDYDKGEGGANVPMNFTLDNSGGETETGADDDSGCASLLPPFPPMPSGDAGIIFGGIGVPSPSLALSQAAIVAESECT